MAYINVDEVYILDNSGAQVDAVADIPFKQDAGLTDAQKAQARANLGISAGGGGGGRNLLDNPWFTVNQRGATGASNSAYGLDRWKGINGGYTVNNDGSVTITGQMRQLGDWSYVWGKTVTISAMNTSGTVASWTGTMAAGTYAVGSMMSVTVTSATEININAVSNLKALKLELGSTSTLAQDAPPDYGEELAKCQYYFERIYADSANVSIANGFASSTTIMYCAFMIKPKRIKPSVSYDAGLGIGTGALSSFTSTAVTVQGFSPDTGHITLQCNATGMTANAAYRAGVMQGHYLDFSADL